MTRRSLYILFLALSLGASGWLAWNVHDGSDGNETPTLCLFKKVTGLPCPSCGTSRAVLLLAHGEFRESLMMNPLGIFAAAGLAAIPFSILVDVLRRKASFYRVYIWLEQFFIRQRWAAVLGVMLVVSNWIWNISKGL